MKKLVLFSGGLDSTTLLAMLSQHELGKPRDEITTLSFKYGSLHEAAEMKAAKVLSDFYHAEHMIYTLPRQLFEGASSALLGQSEMPNETYRNVETEGPSSTVVPFRNGIMISCATAIANSLGIDVVAIAVHASDSAHWSYPDCSPEFVGAMCAAVYAGTFHEVRLVTPFVWHTKTDLVTLAARLHVPLHRTWSCYVGNEVACGTCPTCRERINAFRAAGFVDPIPYGIAIDWTGCDPWQLNLTF